MSDFRAWTFYQEHNGHLYLGTLYAETFEQAEVLAARLDAFIDGEPGDEFCGNCGCQLVGRVREIDDNKTKGH